MNLVADEGVDGAVVERLRRDGHEVVYVAELSPSVADEEVLQEANARSAVLLTADKDFGELVFRRASYTPGSSCSAWRAWRTRPRRRSWPRSVVIAQRNSSERSASCRQDRSGFGERHDDPRGSNFGMQPTACGRG